MMIEQGVSSPSSNVSKHNQDVSNAFYGEDHNADNDVNFHDRMTESDSCGSILLVYKRCDLLYISTPNLLPIILNKWA